MTRPILGALAAPVLLLACTVTETAPAPAPETVQQEVIYGDDDRLEYFEAAEDLQAATRASITFVDDRNLDRSDPESIRFTGATLSDGGICSDEPFANQPTASGCSAFLIDDRLVATAGHCIGRNRCPSTLFASGYYYEDEGELRTITESEIYECTQVVAFELSNSGDFAVFEIDRAATFADPLEVSLDGVQVGDGLTLIGFPSAIPAKVAGNGAVMTSPSGSSFTGSVDAYGGNSGSMVLGDDNRVVGILVAGEQDYVQDGGCARSNFLPQDGRTGGETITDIRPVVEAICAAGYPSEALCGIEGECGDGFCTGEETEESCAEDCVPPPPPEVPDGWECEPEYYDAGDDCDCNCGAYDPDCDIDGLRTTGCRRDEVCGDTGECIPNPDIPQVPDGWECRRRYYDAGDDCDCNCGAYDPDCDNPDLEVVNCEGGEVCSAAGECTEPGEPEPDPEPDMAPDTGVGVDAGEEDAASGDDTGSDADSDLPFAGASDGTTRSGGCATAPKAPSGLWSLAALLGLVVSRRLRPLG